MAQTRVGLASICAHMGGPLSGTVYARSSAQRTVVPSLFGWALWALSPRLDDLCWLRVVVVGLALPVVPQPHVGLDVHRVVLFNVDVHRHQSVGDDN